jgi:transposase-like protein
MKTEGGASRPTEGTPMLRILADEGDRASIAGNLDEIVREGARRMLLTALNAEVAEYVDAHAGQRDGEGKALVVRNGVGRERTVVTAAGGLQIEAPRVDDRREGHRFSSAILPPWARRSPKVSEVLPLHGVHFNIRLEEDRLCCLVLIGVRADGRKELVAVGDGFRESEASWAEVLRDLKRRGMRAPLVGIGDGALGFWAGLREVYPETREQRCWVHKIANILDAVPKSIQPKVKAALHDVMNAEHKEAADLAVDRFVETYGAKYPKATGKLLKDREVLLTHYPPNIS